MSKREKRGKVKWRTTGRDGEKKREGIRRKEWECCLCWLPDSTAVPCVCVGCALNPCQLINPALLHSPQALSTVSATLHNHPTQGWEVQSRSCHPGAWYQTTLHTTATLPGARHATQGWEFGTLNIPAQFTAFLTFYLGSSVAPDVVLSFNPAVLHSVITLLLIKAHFSLIGRQYVLDTDVCHVYSLHYEGQSLNQS